MGYKQMIYYDIQIGNTEEMKNYLEVALNLADECNYHKEMGILLRLKGLNMIMQGNFPEAERLLKESISTFTVTQNVQHRYALNIAGAYNYLGRSAGARGSSGGTGPVQKGPGICQRDRKPTAAGWCSPVMPGGLLQYGPLSGKPESISCRLMNCFPGMYSTGAIPLWNRIWPCSPCRTTRKRSHPLPGRCPAQTGQYE